MGDATVTDAGGSAAPRHLVAILLLVVPQSQIPLDLCTPALPQMVVDPQSTPAAMQNTACGALAMRISARRLAMGALAIFMVGAVVLVGRFDRKPV